MVTTRSSQSSPTGEDVLAHWSRNVASTSSARKRKSPTGEPSVSSVGKRQKASVENIRVIPTPKALGQNPGTDRSQEVKTMSTGSSLDTISQNRSQNSRVDSLSQQESVTMQNIKDTAEDGLNEDLVDGKDPDETFPLPNYIKRSVLQQTGPVTPPSNTHKRFDTEENETRNFVPDFGREESMLAVVDQEWAASDEDDAPETISTHVAAEQFGHLPISRPKSKKLAKSRRFSDKHKAETDTDRPEEVREGYNSSENAETLTSSDVTAQPVSEDYKHNSTVLLEPEYPTDDFASVNQDTKVATGVKTVFHDRTISILPSSSNRSSHRYKAQMRSRNRIEHRWKGQRSSFLRVERVQNS